MKNLKLKCIKESFIKKNHPNIWEDIDYFSRNYNLEQLSWKEKFFHFVFELKSIPLCFCGNPCNFRGRKDKIYNNFCSNKCSTLHTSKKRMETLKENNLIKYGVENVFQLQSVKNKIKDTCEDRYGFSNPNKNGLIKEKIKKTNREKYGVETVLVLKSNRDKLIKKQYECWNNPEWVNWFRTNFINKYGGFGFASNDIKIKCEKTCMSNWGVKNPFQSEEIKEKIVQYYIVKYGVRNPQQVESIHEKSLKTSLKIKKFRNTDMWYQGTYELDFLNKYFDLFKIVRGNPIKYQFEGSKIYYPDFYLSDFDLLVEIKSSYTFDIDLDRNLSKIKHLNENKIGYIFIINKDYTIFNEIIKMNL